MIKILTLILPLAFIAAFSPQVNAQNHNQYPNPNHNQYPNQNQNQYPNQNQNQKQTQFCGQSRSGQVLEATLFESSGVNRSALFIDGQEIAALSERCFNSDRPGTRYIKCAHANKLNRIELYFKILNPKGALQPGAVLWRADKPEAVSMAICQ